MNTSRNMPKPNVIHLVAPDHINETNINPEKLRAYRESRSPLTLILEFSPKGKGVDIPLLTELLSIPCISQFIFITNNPSISLILEHLKHMYQESWIIAVRHEDLLYQHILQMSQ